MTNIETILCRKIPIFSYFCVLLGEQSCLWNWKHVYELNPLLSKWIEENGGMDGERMRETGKKGAAFMKHYALLGCTFGDSW